MGDETVSLRGDGVASRFSGQAMETSRFSGQAIGDESFFSAGD